MYFSFYNILPIVWVCMGVAAAAMAWLLTVYRLRTRIRETEPPEEIPPAALPAVSVIIYANDNAADLRRMLPVVLGQEYPEGKMEVIVVNDGSVDDVTDVVNYLGLQHKNLYITFVPPEAHNLSRKKLAVSLGIKAARNEVIVLTTAEAVPASRRWLRDMAFPFSAEGGAKDVVLGRAAVTGLRRPMLRFDQAFQNALWLSAALHGHPYRGTGFNLAYRRQLFFSAKGFSRSLNLHYGDDDLFVNQISTPDNTAAVLTPGSLVKVRFQRPRHAYRDLRLQHCFTARFLPKGPRRLMGVSTLAIWLWVAAVTVGCVFSLPNWFPACVFAATVPALWIPLTVNWLRTGHALGLRLSPVLLWWEMLWRWLPDYRRRLRCTSSRRRNYTWLQK